MGKQFFVGWATWEKLVFCLAAAIALTVGAAAVKLAHTRWRLRRYGAVTPHQKREQAVQKQMSQKRATRSSHQNDRVPFGIRAIEQGVKVDGVFLSRENTPDLNSRTTSAGSSTTAWDRMSSKPHDVDLEKQDVQHSPLDVSNHSMKRSTKLPERVIYPPRDRSSSAERSPNWSGNLARALSPVNSVNKPSRSHNPPCSYARFRNASYVPRHNLSIASTFEDSETIDDETMHVGQEDNLGSFRFPRGVGSNGGYARRSITASSPVLFSARPASSNDDRTISDFGLLNSHRAVQAAETGQLAPRSRGRKPSLSGSILSLNTSSTALARYIDICSRSPSASASPVSPTFDTLPASIRRSSAPDVQSFDQFCQSAPRPGSIDSRCISPVSALESTSFPPRSRSQLSSNYASARVSQLSLPIAESDEAVPPARGLFEPISSPVLRGHGSGFEVLRPGSLPPSQALGSRRLYGPPIALHNASARRARSLSADGRAKLQKQRYSGLELSDNRWSKGSIA